MKLKVASLSGLPLRYAVARAEGCTYLWYDEVATWWVNINNANRALSPGWTDDMSFLPDIDGRLGAAILEREKISTDYDRDTWNASRFDLDYYCSGPTLLIAGLRCYALSRLGQEIDIPEGLLS